MLDAQHDLSETALSLLSCSQEQLEQIYSKYQLHQAIGDYFREIGVPAAAEEAELPVEFTIDFLTQLQLHKRAGITTLVGILRRHFEDEDNPAQAACDMIVKATCAGYAFYEEITDVFVVKHMIDDALQERIDQFQYPLPMIEQPQPVKHNRQTGYRTIKGSLILRKNHHHEDICLDHINRVNSIPLTLNADVVAFVQNQWKNLDRPKDDETLDDYEKRVRAFQKYDVSSRDVLAAMMAQGDHFWLTHKYDKRGRTYCQGYHITYQGNTWNKACIELADAEPLKES